MFIKYPSIDSVTNGILFKERFVRNACLLGSKIFHNVAANNRIRSQHDVFVNYQWGTTISNNIVADSRYPNSRKFLAWMICIRRSHDKHHGIDRRISYKFLKLEQYYLYLNQPWLEYIVIQLVWSILEIYNYKYQLNSQDSLLR